MKTSVKVSKVWNDGNDQDGLRPKSVTINLWKNNKETNQTLTLSADNNWEATFKDLDSYENGQQIAYTVKEVSVDGYTPEISGTQANGYVITNTHTPETITVSGTKTWDDNNDQDGIRPSSVTINLLQNGKTIDSKEVNADNNWTYSFDNLSKYENGQLITYSITENPVANYSTSYNGYNVTNSYTPGKRSISISKSWDDGNNQDGIRPESITVQLLANGKEFDEKTITANDNWTTTFTDLPVKQAGKDIEYTVEEVSVSGYTTKITGDVTNGFVITNTHTPEVVSVEGTKTWDDNNNQDGLRPDSITVRLYADGVEVKSVEVSEKDNWAYSFTGLAKKQNGQKIKYTVFEDTVKGYTATYNGYNITNKHSAEQTSVSVQKIWNDGNNQDGLRTNAVVVKLLADNQDTGKTVTLSDANSWQAVFDNLDKYVSGRLVQYTVSEDEVKGYTSEITVDVYTGYVITNTHKPETTSVSGTKTWSDNDNQDGMRPESITVNLLKNGQTIDSKVVTEKDNWTYSFDNLAKYDNGKEITYSITENAVEGYSTSVNKYDLVNTHTPGKTSVTVTKSWLDANDQDGLRPESVSVKLIANDKETSKTLVLSDENNWTGSFENLDEYYNGEKIAYSVEEINVSSDYEAKISGDMTNGFVITNTHSPETISVSGTKTWSDNNNQDGMRPKTITVNLFANGEKVDSIEVSEKDNWTYSFDDLAKYDNGKEITYTVTESGVEGYTVKYDGNNIINTHTPKQTSVTVIKNWNDKDNIDKKRASYVEVQLYGNGTLVDTVILNKGNDWRGVFENVDLYNNGKEVVYTVKELTKVDGYTTTVTGNVEEGFVVTNSYVPETKKKETTNTGVHNNPSGYIYTLLVSLVGIVSLLLRKRHYS
ncbi:MAG: Cna B-type domain-containing protein [Erysipelotrichaceae bacterium]|uniref:Cna B-type domain-containing protein n=1 Tax=Floccifex sp. TaxID=2815810 RepID=UPI002A755BB1|nr:Cna B-type domain-containing protein [Floccifex sp.]MDD7282068.1 Cna B-type domain-containing protein [Erysipelotrichaceae bacterium]MDY2958978.1 Cna B-type domain-containing protein [Floccifex sp.]